MLRLGRPSAAYDGQRQFPGATSCCTVWVTASRTGQSPARDIMNTAKGLDAIVVMAEAARGFDANWWNAEPDASIAQLGALLGALGCWRATEDGRRPAALLPAANCLCEKLVFGCASLPLLDENDHVRAAGRCNSLRRQAITGGRCQRAEQSGGHEATARRTPSRTSRGSLPPRDAGSAAPLPLAHCGSALRSAGSRISSDSTAC
jgi:hypothetical protein